MQLKPPNLALQVANDAEAQVAPLPVMLPGATATNDSLAAASVALSTMSIPTFLLQPNCEILFANQAGQELLKFSKAFYLHLGKLAIRRAGDAIALTEAVARVAARGQAELLRFLTRQEEASALMRIQPVPHQETLVVSISELRAPMLLAPGWSKAAFGFSPQNAALAESLALGRSLAEFAEENTLPIGTVRTRLKKLLLQTGTSSQAALAAMLLRAAVIMHGTELLVTAPNGKRPPSP